MPESLVHQLVSAIQRKSNQQRRTWKSEPTKIRDVLWASIHHFVNWIILKVLQFRICCSKVPNLWCFGMSYLGNQRQTSWRCFCVQTHFFTIGACLFRRELCADVKFSKKSCSEGISLGEYLTNLAAVLTRWNQTDRETLSRTGTAWVLHLRTLFNMTKERCILVFDI